MFRMEHDQKMIIKFLLNERSDARDIADRLQAQFGKHAYKLWIVQFWITKVWLGRQDLHDKIRTRRSLLDDLDDLDDLNDLNVLSSLDDLDAKILAILDKSSFEWAPSISETLRVAHSKTLLHLHDSVGFRSFHLYWVLHLLMLDLREKRMEYAESMLPVLHIAEWDDCHHHVTGDESWFFLDILPRRMWTLSRDDMVTKSRLDIQSKNPCLQSCGTRANSMLSTDS
jgi:hypothetical protein